MIMELIWTKHAVQRSYTRLGRYGMDKIEQKIIKNVNKAAATHKGGTAIPFKLGRNRCMAVLMPIGKNGSKALIKSVFPISNEKHYAIFKKKGD
tara:strand:- start:141 stop:422 length:282 start_codon:yes stop_codon:yes gene_type:complete